MWKAIAEIRAPARIVGAKALYLVGVLGCWGMSALFTKKIVWAITQPRGDDRSAMSYAIAGTIAQSVVFIVFIAWLRHVYRSEGGKLAGLILVASGLVSVVAFLLISQFLT